MGTERPRDWEMGIANGGDWVEASCFLYFP
jgi:hypothetical protein